MIRGKLLLLALLFVSIGTAAASNIVFEDDFSGSTLNPAWQIGTGNGSYQLTGGNLRFYNQGPLSSAAGWSTVALNLNIPFNGTQWEADTKATYHLVWLNARGNSSGAQGPQILVSFNSTSPFTNYGGFERVIDAWYQSNDLMAWYNNNSVTGLVNPADTPVINNVADGTYWLQFIRNGASFSMNYSFDGQNYHNALTTTLTDPNNPYNDLMISATTWETVGSYTDYDFVRIQTTGSQVAEPTTLSLIASSLVFIFLKKKRSL